MGRSGNQDSKLRSGAINACADRLSWSAVINIDLHTSLKITHRVAENRRHQRVIRMLPEPDSTCQAMVAHYHASTSCIII